MQHVEGNILLSKADLKALLAHASVDPTRSISCVLFDGAPADPCWTLSGAPIAVATDGHRMLVLQCEGTDGSPAPSCKVTRDALATAAKLVGKGVVSVAGDGLLYVHTAGFQAGPVIPVDATTHEDAFPPWRQVVPDREREHVQTVGLNPTYLGALALACAACGSSGVAVHHGGELDPVVATTAGPSARALAIVMPMRID